MPDRKNFEHQDEDGEMFPEESGLKGPAETRAAVGAQHEQDQEKFARLHHAVRELHTQLEGLENHPHFSHEHTALRTAARNLLAKPE